MLSHKVYTAEKYKEISLKKGENENQKMRVKRSFLKSFKEWTHIFYEKY